MSMLSDDDLDIADMDPEELAAAWDLWFDLAQATNEHDPPYTHGVLAGLRWEDLAPRPGASRPPGVDEGSR